MLSVCKILMMDAKETKDELIKTIRSHNTAAFEKIFYTTERWGDIDLKAVWFYAVEKRNMVAVEALLDASLIFANEVDLVDMLITTLELGSEDCLNLVISRSVNVNLSGKYNISPLQTAIMTNDVGLVDIILSAGANVEYKADNGQYAIMTAAQYGSLRMFNRILNLKPDLHVCDETGSNCIFKAIENTPAVLKILIARGVAFDRTNADGDTPLLWACKGGENPEQALILIEAGAQVDAMDLSKNTPLFYAVKDGNIKLMEALINRGANINVLNNNFETPLMIAARAGKRSAVKLLIENQANITFINKREKTALLYAYEACFPDAVMPLLRNGANIQHWPYNKPFLSYLLIGPGHGLKIAKFLSFKKQEKILESIDDRVLFRNNAVLSEMIQELKVMKVTKFFMKFTVYDIYVKKYTEFMDIFRNDGYASKKSRVFIKFRLHKEKLNYKMKKARWAFNKTQKQAGMLKKKELRENTYFILCDDPIIEKIAFYSIKDELFKLKNFFFSFTYASLSNY